MPIYMMDLVIIVNDCDVPLWKGEDANDEIYSFAITSNTGPYAA